MTESYTYMENTVEQEPIFELEPLAIEFLHESRPALQVIDRLLRLQHEQLTADFLLKTMRFDVLEALLVAVKCEPTIESKNLESVMGGVLADYGLEEGLFPVSKLASIERLANLRRLVREKRPRREDDLLRWYQDLWQQVVGQYGSMMDQGLAVLLGKLPLDMIPPRFNALVVIDGSSEHGW